MHWAQTDLDAIMLFAFLDEFGRSSGRMVDGSLDFYDSPLFGYGGFVVDANKLRPFISEIIRQKSFFLKRPPQFAANIKIKATRLFQSGPRDAEKSIAARKNADRLATKTLNYLDRAGARICFYGVEKSDEFGDSDELLKRACLGNILELLRKEILRQKQPCFVIIKNDVGESPVISYSMAADGSLDSLSTPPGMADSSVTTAIQVADWISELVNKIHIPLSSKKDERADSTHYYDKYHALVMAVSLHNSKIDFHHSILDKPQPGLIYRH
jgi:hypothetical protein